MNAKDAIKYVLSSNLSVMKMYLSDFSDADMLARPVPGANHPAWQLGHLIAGEAMMLEMIGCKATELPAGFAEKYGKETKDIDTPSAFLTKQEYLDLYDKVRAGTLAALDKLPDADLDKPTTGWMLDFAPTYGDAFLMFGNHTMMHAGQFPVLRRKLGKPIVF